MSRRRPPQYDLPHAAPAPLRLVQRFLNTSDHEYGNEWIGTPKDFAESYKWFALAAQQGDQDAAKKRDDVAARLDQQSLVAAKLAVQTWAADPPPDEAMNVKAPAGGWDGAQATGPAKPTVKRKPHSI